MRDGRFLIGTRLHLADGSPDVDEGWNGFLTPGNGYFGGEQVTVLRTTTDVIVSATDNSLGGGCVLRTFDEPGVSIRTQFAWVRCRDARAVHVGDSTVIVGRQPGDNLQLIFLSADGALDLTRGAGAGVVDSGVGDVPISAVAVASTGHVLVASAAGITSSTIRSISLDGYGATGAGSSTGRRRR